MRVGQKRGLDNAPVVDPRDALEIFDGQLFEAAITECDTGVVDQDIDTAKACDHVIDEARYGFTIADIHFGAVAGRPRGLDFATGFVQALDITEGHRGTGLGQGHTQGVANTIAAAAGDDRDLVFETLHGPSRNLTIYLVRLAEPASRHNGKSGAAVGSHRGSGAAGNARQAGTGYEPGLSGVQAGTGV